MSSVLHFSPAFKPKSSLSNLPSSPRRSSKKRKRDPELLDRDSDGGSGEGLEAGSIANGTSVPSKSFDSFFTTPSAAPNVDVSHGDNKFHLPQPFPHHIAETAPLMSKGRISDELVRVDSPFYVATGKVPTVTAETTSSSMGLRQHHLNTITAILHRFLSEGDYIRAGRAWAMFLRAEQIGRSIDLRTHDRWGVGAEILMHHESQVARTLDHNVVEIPNPTSSLSVKAESMENAKEYYDRVILQYPYRKAFPSATEPLSFSIAMFSLWIYTVKERSPMALRARPSSDKDTDDPGAEANVDAQRSTASGLEPDRYRKRELVNRDTLRSAHEIATRLDGLLVSPPYSDDARFWKLCGEISLWIADLSIATIFPNHGSHISEDDEDLTVGDLSLVSNVSRNSSSAEEHRARQERQKALARAQEAFQRVKICGEASAV